MAVAAGAAAGRYIPLTAGTDGGTDTGNTETCAFITTPSVLHVLSVQDVINAVVPTGTLASLSTAQKTSVFKLISKLSADQAQTLVGVNNGPAMANLVQCATGSNVSLVSNTVQVDPRVDAAVSPIWGINSGTGIYDATLVQATLAYNAIKGNTGPVGISIGNGDYHDLTFTTGAQTELNFGTLLGRVLSTAAALKTKICIVVTTDGATATDPEGNNVGDSGGRHTSAMFTYDPAGRHPVTGTQVGFFSSAQVADPVNYIGQSPANAGSVMFGNYLQLNGKLGMLSTVMGTTTASIPDIQALIKFA